MCHMDVECQGNFLPTEDVKANVRTMLMMVYDTEVTEQSWW